jgi:hypothetical protein
MKLFQTSQDRDDELLSAYLDDELSPADRARLESRLKTDSRLRATLQGHRLVKSNLSALPRVKAPRNFSLTPAMAGQPAHRASRLIPALNWATALAAVLFAVLIATDLSFSVGAAPESSLEFAVPAEEGDTANVQDALASVTVTAGAMQSLQAPAAPEPSVEPLTASGTDGQGGGGGSAVPPQITDQQGTGGELDTTESVGFAAESAAETPTPESILRTAGTDESPTLTPEPPPAPDPGGRFPDQDLFATSESYAPVNPVRLFQLGLAALLIVLIVASILVRRR